MEFENAFNYARLEALITLQHQTYMETIAPKAVFLDASNLSRGLIPILDSANPSAPQPQTLLSTPKTSDTPAYHL